MADIKNNPWSVNNLKDFQFYCCPECDVKEKYLETFLQHALNEHDKAKETLPKIIVKAEFEDEENNVDIHNTESDDYGDYEQDFPDEKKSLSRREKTHKKPRKRKQTMQVKKDIKFSDPSELLDVKIKTEEEEMKADPSLANYKCDLCCDKTTYFTTSEKLEDHMEEVHDHKKDIKEYRCELCNSDKIYKDKYNLKLHMKNVHEWNQPRETCNQCSKTFKNVAFLQKHVKSVHEGIRPYKCDSCGHRFAAKKSMEYHVQRVHEGQKNYRCDQCLKRFTTNFSLQTH